MIRVTDVKDADQIHCLLLQFDCVMPHLKEKVADYRVFSEKLSRFARVCVIGEETVQGMVVFYANDSAEKSAYISLLACMPKHQGRGLGRQLMEYACMESVAAGMEKMRLEVDLDNPGAIAFYRKLGFAAAGEQMSNSMYLEKKLAQGV